MDGAAVRQLMSNSSLSEISFSQFSSVVLVVKVWKGFFHSVSSVQEKLSFYTRFRCWKQNRLPHRGVARTSPYLLLSKVSSASSQRRF
mmetsp:Transcript_11317/g.47154  ORF Transcript_11317/g.47154 Transcript_11317/m.47154 type:complete len:88 (-) Transcript_11317:2280-2543(-)